MKRLYHGRYKFRNHFKKLSIAYLLFCGLFYFFLGDLLVKVLKEKQYDGREIIYFLNNQRAGLFFTEDINVLDLENGYGHFSSLSHNLCSYASKEDFYLQNKGRIESARKKAVKARLKRKLGKTANEQYWEKVFKHFLKNSKDLYDHTIVLITHAKVDSLNEEQISELGKCRCEVFHQESGSSGLESAYDDLNTLLNELSFSDLLYIEKPSVYKSAHENPSNSRLEFFMHLTPQTLGDTTFHSIEMQEDLKFHCRAKYKAELMVRISGRKQAIHRGIYLLDGKKEYNFVKHLK